MKRVEAILKDPFYNEYLNRNKAREVDRKFCRHTIQHALDVARIAYILTLEDGNTGQLTQYDLDKNMAKVIIYTAAVLHDIGRWKEYDTGEDHAVVSAQLSEEILLGAGFSQREISIITRGISEHRYPKEMASGLGELLYRADKLSRLCSQCEAHSDCYKFEAMETGRHLIY